MLLSLFFKDKFRKMKLLRLITIYGGVMMIVITSLNRVRLAFVPYTYVRTYARMDIHTYIHTYRQTDRQTGMYLVYKIQPLHNIIS